MPQQNYVFGAEEVKQEDSNVGGGTPFMAPQNMNAGAMPAAMNPAQPAP